MRPEASSCREGWKAEAVPGKEISAEAQEVVRAVARRFVARCVLMDWNRGRGGEREVVEEVASNPVIPVGRSSTRSSPVMLR